MQLAQSDQLILSSSLADKISSVGKVLDFTRNFSAIFFDGTLHYVNPVGVALFGCKNASELIGVSFGDILHPSYKDIASIGFDFLIEEENLLIKFQSTIENSVDVHLWVSHMPDIAEGAYLLEAREITKHLRSAAELQVREQHLQAVLNTVPDCILTLDKGRKIIAANPATIAEFKLEAGSVRQKDIADLVPHLADVELWELLDSSWDRSYQSNKYWFGLRAGETFPIELVMRAMQEGPETNYTCIIRNVEEREQA